MWNYFPAKGNFSFWKSQKSQGTKSELCECWVSWVIWCLTQKLCMRRDAWAGVLSWCSCQSWVAQSCGLLNHPNSFQGGMFKLNAKFDADSLFYSLSHFEYSGHRVHMLTHWRIPPLLTRTVKSSLFMHVHSSLLSVAARLHQCLTNRSHYTNNGWIFSDRPWYSRYESFVRYMLRKYILPVCCCIFILATGSFTFW